MSLAAEGTRGTTTTIQVKWSGSIFAATGCPGGKTGVPAAAAPAVRKTMKIG